MMTSTKLHINIGQGIVDVEGDLEFVREVYSDFKDGLLSSIPDARSREDKPESKKQTNTVSKSRRKGSKKKTSKSDDGVSTINADTPKMDKSLDTSRLQAFYSQFEPKNNAEKILIFLKFLGEELSIEAPNTDQVYTCYEAANERVPKAFSQAFRDASGRKFGYIDYNSPTELVVTTNGNNHFKFDLKRSPMNE